MKRFKAKRKRKNKLRKMIIGLLILIILWKIIGKQMKGIVEDNINQNKLVSLLIKTGFNYQLKEVDSKNLSVVEMMDKLGLTSVDDGDNKKNNEDEPIVYLYNTHDEEEYDATFLEAYNIKPNVKIISYYLEELLNKDGVNTIVEEEAIDPILKKNNWPYRYSYKASRILLDQAIVDHPSLRFFIDIHRDSTSRDKTTADFNGLKYAKVLFIVGLEHDNYQANLAVAKILQNKIKNKYAFLDRGIYEKEGVGVNGIYNQDFNDKTILMEIGGQYNTIDEVKNTLDLLAPLLASYFKENI